MNRLMIAVALLTMSPVPQANAQDCWGFFEQISGQFWAYSGKKGAQNPVEMSVSGLQNTKALADAMSRSNGNMYDAILAEMRVNVKAEVVLVVDRLQVNSIRETLEANGKQEGVEFQLQEKAPVEYGKAWNVYGQQVEFILPGSGWKDAQGATPRTGTTWNVYGEKVSFTLPPKAEQVTLRIVGVNGKLGSVSRWAANVENQLKAKNVESESLSDLARDSIQSRRDLYEFWQG